MIRTFLEFQIQTALDRSPRLPLWLRLGVRCDTQLRQFAEESNQLDKLLRRGAYVEREAFLSAPSNGLSCESVELATSEYLTDLDSRPRKRALLGWASAVALAASIAMALFSIRTSEKQARAEHAEFLARQLTAVPEEMVSMLNLAVKNPQLSRYNPLARLTIPEPQLLVELSNQTQTRIRGQLDSLIAPWQSVATSLQGAWLPTGEPGT